MDLYIYIYIYIIYIYTWVYVLVMLSPAVSGRRQHMLLGKYAVFMLNYIWHAGVIDHFVIVNLWNFHWPWALAFKANQQ